MSYDLAVFDLKVAPSNREEFLRWWNDQSEWSEEHTYDDPAVSTPELRGWFLEMNRVFPAMNGPYAQAERPTDDDSITDYSIGRNVIYAAFRWSKAEPAYDTAVELAQKHGVGFFDVSSDNGEVWLPGPNAELTMAHYGYPQREE
jgi:hypothetical protein